MAVRRFAEDAEDFFVEQLCTRADHVYRLAFALTLNIDDARTCVEKAFAAVVNDLGAAQRASNPLVPLAKACVEAFPTVRGGGGKGGSSRLIALMKSMSADVRGAVVAVDGIGLSAREAAEVFAMPEKRLREALAEGRRRLVAGDARL